MVNLSVWARVIPDAVETTSGVSLSLYLLTEMIMNYLAPVRYGCSLPCWTEDGHSALVGSIENLVYDCISFSCLPAWLVLGIAPMGFFPLSSSFTNKFFVDSPDPLTGYSDLLHTLHVFVGQRDLTRMQSVPWLSTYSSYCWSSSVCNFMRRRPNHLPLLAFCVRKFALIYPGNRIRLDRQLWHIRCYKMCSNNSGLWCWDATTQAASDDARFQLRGWRQVVPFLFEVCARQGRVNLPQKSLRGVRAPNKKIAVTQVRKRCAKQPIGIWEA